MEKLIEIDSIHVDGEDWVVEFEACFHVVDNSFDYAGTHCTGGRSGTHTQFDWMLDSWVAIRGTCYPESGSIINAQKIVYDEGELQRLGLAKQMEALAEEEIKKHAPTGMPERDPDYYE